MRSRITLDPAELRPCLTDTQQREGEWLVFLGEIPRTFDVGVCARFTAADARDLADRYTRLADTLAMRETVVADAVERQQTEAERVLSRASGTTR